MIELTLAFTNVKKIWIETSLITSLWGTYSSSTSITKINTADGKSFEVLEDTQFILKRMDKL